MSIFVPAYSYPTPPAGYWTTVISGAPTVNYLVANVDSGPGVTGSADPSYTTVIGLAQATPGLTVLGYVDTEHTSTSIESVETQINLWNTYYPGVTSIFLDNVSTDTGADLTYYTTLCNYIHAAHAGAIVMLNHGTIPNQAYAAIGDVMIVFEGPSYTDGTGVTPWPDFSPPSWFSSYPASRFAVLIYETAPSTGLDGGTPLAWQTALAQAQAAGIGNVYLTDATLANNPYDVLPTYWAAEVTAIAAPGGGGFTNPMMTLGDTLYENGAPTAVRLAGNTSATKNFLTQTGNGTISTAPAWGTVAAGDVPTLNQNTTGTASNITDTLDHVPVPAANVSMNSHKITSVAAAQTSGDALPYGQAATGDLGGSYPNPTVLATHLGSPLPVAQGGTANTTGAGIAPNIQWFNGAPGIFTWNKPSGAQTVYVIAVGGGGQGGSGAAGTPAAARAGGGGGAGGGVTAGWLTASQLPSSVTVTVGAGGNNAGAAVTGTNTGNVGQTGSNSMFGTYMTGGGGQHGGGGGAGAAGTGGAGGTGTALGGAGGASTVGGGLGNAAVGAGGAVGGGSGGGLAITTQVAVNGAGSSGFSALGSSANTAAGGVVNSTAPGTGSSITIQGNVGCGGGGGASSITTNAQAGANAAGYGGGGGGGGAANSSFHSGAGGTGAQGYVLVITHFQ